MVFSPLLFTHVVGFAQVGWLPFSLSTSLTACHGSDPVCVVCVCLCISGHDIFVSMCV